MDRDLSIGTVIARKRREKDITQEELAAWLGVSKPAVSKWESGQSYPDILLLPMLAAYFGISVDDLLGYRAQMTREDIRKLYLRLSDAFAREPFDKVHAECRSYVKDYYACWGLLFAMAQLLVNHAALAGDPSSVDDILAEASGLFERVERESRDASLSSQALAMRAYCALALRRPDEAIEMLDGIEESPLTTEVLLAKAYAAKGNFPKARSLLQGCIYRNLVAQFGALIDLLAAYADDPARTDECLDRALALGDAFGLREMHPSLYFGLYLTAASAFLSQRRTDRALDMLEQYVELLGLKGVFPLRLKGNGFFDLLGPLFESFNLGSSVPRSNKLILKDLRSAVLGNPAFQSLTGNERYEKLVRRFSHLEVDESEP